MVVVIDLLNVNFQVCDFSLVKGGDLVMIERCCGHVKMMHQKKGANFNSSTHTFQKNNEFVFKIVTKHALRKLTMPRPCLDPNNAKNEY